MVLKRIAAVVFIWVVFFSATGAFAAQGVRPGIQLGINYVSLNYEDPMDVWEPGWRVGYSAGGFIEIPLATNFSLQPGLRYVQLGNKVDVDIGSEQQEGRLCGEFKIIQNYLSVPILFKVNLHRSPTLFLLAGPEMGFLMSARSKESETIEFESPSFREERSTDEDISENLESSNISLNAGLGIEFEVAAHSLHIQLQYSHGLTETAKEESWITNWKTREIRTSIGYLF